MSESRVTHDQAELGRSGIRLSPLGVGTWPWGDGKVWRFDPVKGPRDAEAAFHAALDRGVTLFDTAEIYGRGKSEELLGRFIRESGRTALVATKFAPLPLRLSARTLPGALDASLARLGLERVDLYQVHWPYTLLTIPALMDQMARQVELGKVRAVGVSNYSADDMRRAHAALAAHGVPLASNQVIYHLLDRSPERNGVLDACRALGITLIAYSPLAMGALSGKYDTGASNAGLVRRYHPHFARYRRAATVLRALRAIAEHHRATPAQVALRWLIERPGVVPIPSARNAAQSTDNAGALDFRLDPEELALLDRFDDPASWARDARA
jgi:aryl-alcohol dehydrogenase-like predicted oxidoreductase